MLTWLKDENRLISKGSFNRLFKIIKDEDDIFWLHKIERYGDCDSHNIIGFFSSEEKAKTVANLINEG